VNGLLLSIARAAVSRLPQFPHSVALAIAASLLLHDRLAPQEASRLAGRVVRLEVRDAGLRFTLCLVHGRYAPCLDATPPDVTIAADARALALLALGRADPDTLFFERRLVIEGDTEAGLIVKNALDRIGSPLPPALCDWLAERLSREENSA
jgi:predicted lipid carrier protein YhbT